MNLRQNLVTEKTWFHLNPCIHPATCFLSLLHQHANSKPPARQTIKMTLQAQHLYFPWVDLKLAMGFSFADFDFAI